MTDNPLSMLTKWITNLEGHELNVKREIEEQKKILANYEGALAATRAWLVKFKDLFSLLDGTTEESIRIIDRENDPSATKELGTHFERIRAFLRSKGNDPKTVAEIEAGTGIARTSISAVIYRTHEDKFVPSHASDKRGKVWSLKPNDEDASPPPEFSPPPLPNVDSVFSEEMFKGVQAALKKRLQARNPPPPPPQQGEDIPF